VNGTIEHQAASLGIMALYAAHSPFVWRRLQQLGVCASDLEDAMQDVFVAAFRNWSQFEPARAKATTWLFGICHNVARNLARGQRRRERHLDRDAEPHAEPATDTPEESFRRLQSQTLFDELLAALSVEHRTTLLLFEIEGMSGREISEEMQVPEGTVRSRLQHARRQLETALKRPRQAASTQRAVTHGASRPYSSVACV
jgi:RNA polymerase sigma-70 factor (ECF subfamily)